MRYYIYFQKYYNQKVRLLYLYDIVKSKSTYEDVLKTIYS